MIESATKIKMRTAEVGKVVEPGQRADCQKDGDLE
jgi:hypothetical protein